MGSFTSRPEIESKSFSDDTLVIPSDLDYHLFMDWIKEQLPEGGRMPLLARNYRHAPGKGEAAPELTPFRVMQWNTLAQSLGTHADNFSKCPSDALEWDRRKFKLVEEILSHDPDVVCLQEVDHFRFVQRMLETQGFEGIFVPKPDSPCIYLPENSGPDGCALFFRTDRFKLIDWHSKTLEVWGVESNQVALLANLKDLDTGCEVCVLTTHLKARKGALVSSLRYEQVGDLLKFSQPYSSARPTVICGDFNGECTEPLYTRMIKSGQYTSSYATLNDGKEPEYSTWKIRGDGECKSNIDYIFYTNKNLVVEGGIDCPREEVIGVDRVPSLAFPSDHFSLISDISFKTKPDELKNGLTKGR